MRKLQIEDAEVMRIAIQQEIGRSEESRYDHRLHGLLLVAAGLSCRAVAELLGENGTTVPIRIKRRDSRKAVPCRTAVPFNLVTGTTHRRRSSSR